LRLQRGTLYPKKKKDLVMSGLLALLDDVAAIAKVAAASVDDIAGAAAKAGAKAAGVVIDDAAVTPKYVHGFDAHRELPIIWRIALGSLKNKLIILLPAALLLANFAPWAITPLLMIGGAYLCFEGAEKVFHWLFPHGDAHVAADMDVKDKAHLEEEKVAGAIKTDFILSAEIMTIALAAIPESNFWMEAITLAVVGALITVAVYGTVALIVKMDDIGLHMAATGRTSVWRGLGRGLVAFMPKLMAFLSIVGTAAMLWVGGSIILHGASDLGWGWLYNEIHHLAEMAAHAVPQAAGFVAWVVTAALDGVFGLILGLLLIPLATRVITPLWAAVTGKPKAAH
jgi:predicted DNA repair protein MutK